MSEVKICNKPTAKGSLCQNKLMNGCDTCYHHLAPEEKQQRKAKKKEVKTTKPTVKELMETIREKDIQIEILTDMISKMRT